MIVSCCSKVLLLVSSIVIGVVHSSKPTKLHVLVYETSKDAIGIDTPSQRLVDQINNGRIDRMVASIFGQSSSSSNDSDNGFVGYGSKFHSVQPILTSIMNNNNEYDNLVVISDSRDVLLNNPFNDYTYSNELVDEFRIAYDDITVGNKNSIIISAEAQCCVSALTHVPLGGYYNTDGTRNQFACSSGSSNCLWAGDDKAQPWENFMNTIMIQNNYGIKYDDAYLNSGLMVGTPENLLRIIHNAQILDNEDDQAVWTDYMYHNPHDIVLDYQQKLFGNNRGGVAAISSNNNQGGGCVFEKQSLASTGNNNKRLIHIMTNTQPLFIHSPGAYFTCHDELSNLLNVPQVSSIVRRKLTWYDLSRRSECNYGRLGSNCTAPVTTTSAPVPVPAPTSLLDLLLTPKATPTIAPALVPVPVPSPPTSLFDLLKPQGTPTIAPIVTVPVPVPTAPTSLYEFLQPKSSPTIAPVTGTVRTLPVAAPVPVPVPVPLPTTGVVPISTYLKSPTKSPVKAPVKCPTPVATPVATTKGNSRGGTK
jgi:hypothetical protein